MNDDTAGLLRESLERYTAERYSFERRSALLREPPAGEKAWNDYAEMGWLALRLPTEAGGIDGDATAIGIVMETVGARLLMEPILASAVLGTGLLLRLAEPRQLADALPRLAGGDLTLAVADSGDVELRNGRLHGRCSGVLHGDRAGAILVVARDGGSPAVSLVAHDAPGLTRQACVLVDGRGAATLEFSGAIAEPLGGSAHFAAVENAVALMQDEAAAAACAEAHGVARRLVETTCGYLKVRRQFGRALSTHQALQHRLTELYLLQQEIGALARRAERAFTLPAEARRAIVGGAAAYAMSALRRVANESVQLHGGVGVTEELDVSHYFRRAMVIGALFGGRERCFDRFLAAQP